MIEALLLVSAIVIVIDNWLKNKHAKKNSRHKD